MFVKLRFSVVLVTAAMLMAVTGCAGIAVENPVVSVDSDTVVTQLNYVDGSEVGPAYDVSLTVPSDWVGQFEVRNVGNAIYFDYLPGSDVPAEIFFVEALSPLQFWEQNGNLPGSYTNVANLGDTYFVYHLPIDAYYSGLPEEQFAGLAEAVPGVIASFTAEESE